MAIKNFEDIVGWQKAQQLSVELYSIFRKNNDFNFRQQICGASVSISNNIAEGFDRGSTKYFIHFLYISLGSCSEVRSMLYLAEKLNYIENSKASELRSECFEISKILKGLIRSMK